MSDSWLEDLSYELCVELLRTNTVGRIGLVIDDAPAVLPVNYRLVETVGLTFLALRTRPGNLFERADLKVALEIDGIDPTHQEGWSVLARGTLHRVDPDAADFKQRFDPEPWLTPERDAWLIIEPYSITGRRLHAPPSEWHFHPRGYL
jgi:nitroimidazol reductase NimA-like FMN-containing flavoprotein (pyridoxamine 5'-phosphate oxidase superfamily)